MSSKILIADDSLTIQKVIGITLASSGYELVECHKEDDLSNILSTNHFDLILLDFNLSDTKSGYDLSIEIKKQFPKAGLIVMLGTFDSVDESKFGECGINDKIVKPFESSKFIKKCKEVLENSSNQTFEYIAREPEVKPTETESDNLDSWVVDAPNRSETIDTEFKSDFNLSDTSLDPLSSEVEGWGFAAEENLESKYNKVFPPVIEESREVNVIERLQNSSSLLNSYENEDDFDATNPTFELPQDLNRDLLSEIDEDVSTEAFWAVDEVVPVKSEESDTIKETRLDEVTADLTDTVNLFRKNEIQNEYESIDYNYENLHSATSNTVQNIDLDELVAKLKVALLPQLENMVKEYCREMAEKVSWEVIPDLAENLIKKELKEISDSEH